MEFSRVTSEIAATSGCACNSCHCGKVKRLEAEIVALKRDNAELRSSLDTANAEVKRLACMVVEKEEAVCRLRAEVAALKLEYAEMRDSRNHWESEARKFKKELEQSERRASELAAKLDVAEKLLSDALLENDKLRREYQNRVTDVVKLLSKPL